MKFPNVKALLTTTTDQKLKDELTELLMVAEEKVVGTIEKSNLDKFSGIIGKVFIKTNTVIAGTVPPKGATVVTQLERVDTCAKKRGIIEVLIDPNIVAWFGNAQPSEKAVGSSRLVRFAEAITHRGIIANAKQVNLYQAIDIVEALDRIVSLIGAGELDEKNGRGVLIYLKNLEMGLVCRLYVWRSDSGALRVDIYEVIPDFRCDIGDGVLISEETA